MAKTITQNDIQVDADRLYPINAIKIHRTFATDLAISKQTAYIKGRIDERAKSISEAIAFNAWVEKSVHNRLADGKYIIDVNGKFKTLTAEQLYKMWRDKQ